MSKKLCTIDANTLQSVDYEPISFLVEDLLPPGLHLLAGSTEDRQVPAGPVDMSLCRTGQIALELRYIRVKSLPLPGRQLPAYPELAL